MEKNNVKGCVYFFRHIGLTPIKIGYSNNESPIDRFNQFKTYAPYGSEIIGFIQTSDAKQLETKLHTKYANKRLDGEWFEISEKEAIAEIDFYSNIEDVIERNLFQQQWAMHIKNKHEIINTIISESKTTNKKEIYKMNYYNNKLISINEKAKLIGVTRKTISIWNREIIKDYGKSMGSKTV